ncbi:hypothetical protein CDD83_5410 [Cordyceps sp. RAO-2017]|nr:hypothetical protein CDD83_5410 [Cordyceps sp. RAO-2017]
MPCDLDSPPSAPLIPDLLDSQSILGGGLVQRRDGAARMAADASLGSLPVLSTQADWPSWLQQIEALARLSGIWDYVDPDGGQHLEEPARPVAPATPSFDSWTQRQMAETDEECQARFAEHKLQLDLIGRTFDIHHERYRIECHEYSIKLAEHAAARDEMGQLNRIIYAGVDKHWRAHLVGDMAATPRLKLKILASLMAGAGAPPQPPPASASPPPSSSHFAQLMDKLRCQGPRDWTLWACSVANLAEK